MAIFAEWALLPEGWARDVRIEITGGRFGAIMADSAPCAGDARVATLLPGMPNLHSHAFQHAFAGRTERRGGSDDSFWTWREEMYRFALAMSPEDVEAVAAQLYVEMLEAGFTRVGEFHYLHHDRDGAEYANIGEMAARIAAAAGEAGIGLTLLPVFYAHSGFGGAAPNEGQRRFITGPDRFAKLMEAAARAVAPLPAANLGIAPHSLRAVTGEELAAVLPLAKGEPVHIHISEQVKEVEDCIAHCGARPVEWLLDHAPVDERWCLIHATHMTLDETLRMAKSGAVAGLCPITEANLGDGIFNAPEFIGAGGAFGIGSDSNVEIGLGGELRLFEYGQRLIHHGRNRVAAPNGSTGRALYEGALKGGGQALGAASGIGEGMPADFITLRSAHADWAMPEGDGALDALIFAPGLVEVDAVFVRGQQLVSGGRHIRREEIARQFGAVMRRLAD